MYKSIASIFFCFMTYCTGASAEYFGKPAGISADFSKKSDLSIDLGGYSGEIGDADGTCQPALDT